MATHEIHLDCLLDRKIFDSSGQTPVGRIEEIRVTREGSEWRIKDYLIGPQGMMQRFSAWDIGLALLRLFGATKGRAGKCIPWDKLDLSDPEKPRLTCAIEDLAEFRREEAQGE